MIHAGAYLAVVPDGARLRDDRRRLRRLITATAGVLTLLATAWTVLGSWLPDEVGRQLFEATWPGAEEIMVPMGLVMVAGGFISGGFLGVRSLGEADVSLRVRVLSAPGQLVLPIVGAMVGDAVGFAVGLALGARSPPGSGGQRSASCAARATGAPPGQGVDSVPVGVIAAHDGE